MNSDKRLTHSPNSAWDYATVRRSLELAKAGINDALEYMVDVEKATTESDWTLVERIEAVRSLLNSCVLLLKK